MKAVEKKRIDCDALITKIQACPALKTVFGTQYSKTFLKFVGEYKATSIHECTK